MIETILTLILTWFCLGATYITINAIDENYEPTILGIIITLPLLTLTIITSLPFIIQNDRRQNILKSSGPD